jgi:hypothetical protein
MDSISEGLYNNGGKGLRIRLRIALLSGLALAFNSINRSRSTAYISIRTAFALLNAFIAS